MSQWQNMKFNAATPYIYLAAKRKNFICNLATVAFSYVCLCLFIA